MILQALGSYYKRRRDLAPEGWIHKDVDFVIVLNPAGELVQVNDLRKMRNKKMVGKISLLPNIGKQAQKHTNSGTDANLLWDNAQFLFGIGKRGSISTRSFLETLERYFSDDAEPDAGVEAVKAFLRRIVDDPQAALPALKALPEKNGAILPVTIAFRLADDEARLVSDRAVVQKRLSFEASDATTDSGGICLVTGEKRRLPVRIPSSKVCGEASPRAGASFLSMQMRSNHMPENKPAAVLRWVNRRCLNIRHL